MRTPEDRQKARQLADRLQAEKQAQGGEFTDWFEELYARAEGDSGLVPWGDEQPHEGLVEWIAGQAPGKGRRAVDVGCGLGDNAAFLADHGWRVTAFDLSPSAVAWAQERFSDKNIDFLVADLFALSQELIGAFDLVHETYTIQALPLEIREVTMDAVVRLLAPGGTLLVICRGRPDDATPDGPPWPLSREELTHFERQGLSLTDVANFDEHKPDGRIIPHFRLQFEKPC